MAFEINDKVISSRFGIGQITGVETLGPGDQQFISVSVIATNAKILVPQKDLKAMRKLSTPQELTEALKRLSTPQEVPLFASKKDRVLYFKAATNNQSLNDRVNLIGHLWNLEDKGKVEISIFTNMKEILVKEIQEVFGITHQEAEQWIDDAQSKTAA